MDADADKDKKVFGEERRSVKWCSLISRMQPRLRDSDQAAYLGSMKRREDLWNRHHENKIWYENVRYQVRSSLKENESRRAGENDDDDNVDDKDDDDDAPVHDEGPHTYVCALSYNIMVNNDWRLYVQVLVLLERIVRPTIHSLHSHGISLS